MGLLAIMFVNHITFITLMYVFESVLLASVIVFGSAFVVYMALQFSLYSMNGYKLSKVWYIIDTVLIVIFSVGLLISLGKRDDIENFEAQSAQLFFIVAVLLVVLAFVTTKNSR